MAVSTGVDGVAEACGLGIRIADAVGLRGRGLDNQFEVGHVDGDVVQCEDEGGSGEYHGGGGRCLNSRK